MVGRETGIVKWFNNRKGFGFIERDTGDDAFAHYKHIRISEDGFRALYQGQRVDFSLADSGKGPLAEDIVVLEEEL